MATIKKALKKATRKGMKPVGVEAKKQGVGMRGPRNQPMSMSVDDLLG